MSLPAKWSYEDFATLFQYFWYRDFPLDQISVGAKRVDWTIHIGLVVRNIADLMGLVARFESGGRTDTVLRSYDGDEIAVEFEWSGIWGKNNEIDKLAQYETWSRDKGKERPLKYAVLITYTHAHPGTPEIQTVYDRIQRKWNEQWKQTKYPLLVILIDSEKTKSYSSGRGFKNINVSVFDSNGRTEIREAPAYPWDVEGSRWHALKNLK